jgi:hypothetical protein
MLSINFIERLFAGRRFDQLIDAIAANGLVLPLSLRVRLAQSPVAATALGLKRVAELTYRPTTLSRAMAAELIAAQRGDGSFAGDDDQQSGDPILTAVVAAALGVLIADHRVDEPAVLDARDRAVEALARMQDSRGLFPCRTDRTEQDEALAGAFICYMLAADEAFRRAVRVFDLLDYLDQYEYRLDDATDRLYRMARAEAPPAPARETAEAALAA